MKLYMDLPGFKAVSMNQGDFFFKEVFSAIITEAHSIFCFDKEEIKSDEFVQAFLKDNLSYWPQARRSFDQNIENDIKIRNLSKIHEAISIHEVLDKLDSFHTFGVLAGNPEDIADIFLKIFLNRPQKDFDRTYTIGDNFQSWSDLSDIFCPLNDIIIVDPFCLDLNEAGLRKNLLALLPLLTKNQKNRINIVIYTLEDKVTCCNDKGDVCSKIFTEFLLKHSKCSEINTTLIAVGGFDKELVKELKEHDRIVATNYFSIITGNSHTFINQDDTLSPNSRFLEVKSHFKDENQKYFKGIINDIQKAINISHARTTVKIFGAKKSNYLNF
jgi:hypothetical protein